MVEKSDEDYFSSKCSKVADYLFLGPEKMISNNWHLKNSLDILKQLHVFFPNEPRITHVVHCLESVFPFPDDFEHVQLLETDPILLQFERLSEFIHQAKLRMGVILIYGELGQSWSAALVVSHIMEIEHLSYYEASIFVKEKRYIYNPSPTLVRQLVEWGNRLNGQRISPVAYYQVLVQLFKINKIKCWCGATIFSLLIPFNSKDQQNPRPCSCQVCFYKC